VVEADSDCGAGFVAEVNTYIKLVAIESPHRQGRFRSQDFPNNQSRSKVVIVLSHRIPSTGKRSTSICQGLLEVVAQEDDPTRCFIANNELYHLRVAQQVKLAQKRIPNLCRHSIVAQPRFE